MCKKMSPSEIVNGFDYAILNHITGHVTGSLYRNVRDATGECEVTNRTYIDEYRPYEVVEIDHDADADCGCTCVDGKGNIVCGISYTERDETMMWYDMFARTVDYVRQGVNDADSGGYDNELSAYRVVLAYMYGMMHANGITDIG